MLRQRSLWSVQCEVAPGGVACLLLLSLTLIPGCASTGQPQPPSLNLPSPVEKLTAERVGDQVKLAWNTPATTTDGGGIRGAILAVICLDSAPSSAAAVASARKSGKRPGKQAAGPSAATPAGAVCDAVQRLPVAPGPGSALVAMAPAQTTGAPTLLAYRVELQNARGRSAGVSAPVYVAAGAAPPAVGPVAISARREGALLQWKPEQASALMELQRTLIATAAGEVTSTPAVKPAKTPFSPRAGKTPAREVVLRAEAASDAGGMLDRTVTDGDTYSYTAQRVRSVTLGGHALELRGAPSPATTLVYHDVFPPRAPAGLVLVPGGGFGQPPSIDLSWDANAESDLLGYLVYRSEGVGSFLKLTEEPVPAPAYRDLHVEAGHTYTYRVTAIDQRHNESEPGAVARERLRN